MSKKPTLKGEVVRDFLEQFPNEKSLTLAKQIYHKGENSKLFDSVEHIRNLIRYYRGAQGRKHLGGLASKEFVREFERTQVNPLQLPESDEVEWLPYYLNQKCSRILGLWDIHIPYHSIDALTVALKHGQEFKADTIFLGGDLMDCYQLSRFGKDPRKRRFSEELEATREMLRRIRDLFPDARIYLKEGNHEERLQTYIQNRAPELQLEETRLPVLLRLGELQIEWIEEKRICYAGKLALLHGHEFRQSTFSPVNPARGYYIKAKRSMIAGHNHQTSEHTEPDLAGDVETVWSVGCLCELNPGYMPINKWNHGFATIEVNPANGNFHVSNYRIRGGEIL